MTGKLVLLVKKWWILVLVGTLALSLTSCSSRRSDTGLRGNFGLSYCDGTLGQFDVYTIPVSGTVGQYEVTIVPVVVTPGDVVRIAIGNQQNDFKMLISQAAINQDIPLTAIISEDDLFNFPIIAIRAWEPGVGFLDGTTNFDAVCELALPGDPIGQAL